MIGLRRAAGRSCTRGVTYVWTLIAVALLGAGLAAAARVWDTAAKREREAELLFAGRAFRNAIEAYHDATPGLVKVFPRALGDLLEDRRYPQTRRHLRRIYDDPMTRRADWGLVRAPDGGIAGVYSRSDAAALRSGGFSGPDAEFEGKLRYSEWRFVHAAGIDRKMPGVAPTESAYPGGARD